MFTAITRQHEVMGRPITTATLVRVKATLRTALNAAIRAGHITTNAASRAELAPARRPEAVVWTAERISEWQRTGIRPSVAVWTPAQTAAFLNAIQGHRLYAAYHLIALRGRRRGEAAGLRWCDLDLDTGTGTAIISWQLQQYDGHVTLCPPKTAHSERIIALDRTSVAALRAHRARSWQSAPRPAKITSTAAARAWNRSTIWVVLGELGCGDVPDPGASSPRMVSWRTWPAPRRMPSAFTRSPNAAAGSKVAMTLVEARSRTGSRRRRACPG